MISLLHALTFLLVDRGVSYPRCLSDTDLRGIGSMMTYYSILVQSHLHRRFINPYRLPDVEDLSAYLTYSSQVLLHLLRHNSPSMSIPPG